VQLLPVWASQFAGGEKVAVALTEAEAGGRFTLLGVPAGVYVTSVLVAPRAGDVTGRQAPAAPTLLSPDGVSLSGATPIARPQTAARTGDTWWASASIEVGLEGPADAVNVELQRGFRVSGRIRVESAPDPVQAPVVELSLLPLDQSSGSAQIPGVRSDEGGRFTTLGVPAGAYFVQASVVPPSSYLVKAILLAGKDIQGDPIDLKADVPDLEVIVTDRPASISGSVLGLDLRVPGDAEVVVFPADRLGWRIHGALLTDRRVTTARMLATGRYLVTGLPAGQYFIAAVLPPDMGDYQDPRFLERLISASTKVVLKDGEAKTQDLRAVALGIVR
jgi:hypothetical protein